MSFDFLEQAFRFAVHNSVCKSWTLENCKQYLRTCGFHGKLFESTWEAIMVARRDNLSQDTIHPPPLWCKYKSLGLNLHHFVDTPMQTESITGINELSPLEQLNSQFTCIA